MRKRFLLLLLGISFFFSACSFAPKYTQPEAPVPAGWEDIASTDGSDSAAESQAVHELTWQNFFKDERLKKVIEMALDNNRDLKLAALNIERARAIYGIQRAELLPAVTAGGGGSKGRTPADLSRSGKPSIYEEYSVSMGISSWEIDFFGRIRNLKDQALQEFLATTEAERSARISLISAVAGAYLTLAADREALTLARATLETQQAALDLTQKRYDVGVVNELALHQSQTQVYTAREQLARYIQQAAHDKNTLDLLLGSPVPEDLLPPDLESVVPPQELSPRMNSKVLLLRPDILQAEHRLKGAYANIGAARAAFFPRISLTTTFGTASADLSGLFKAGSGTWNFSPQIAMPIFDARTWAAYEVTQVEREIALTNYEKAIQTAFKEVADSLAVRNTIHQRLAAQESLVHSVGETYRLSNERYTQGIDSYLGVLDAQRSLYGAQQGLILLRLAKAANQVTFYTVLGGGSE